MLAALILNTKLLERIRRRLIMIIVGSLVSFRMEMKMKMEMEREAGLGILIERGGRGRGRRGGSSKKVESLEES